MKTRIFIDQEVVKVVKKYVKLPKVEGEKQKYEKRDVKIRSIVRTTKEWQDTKKHYADIEKDAAKKARKELKAYKSRLHFKLKWFSKEIEKEIFIFKRRKNKILRTFKIKVHTQKAVLQTEKSIFNKDYGLFTMFSHKRKLKPNVETIVFKKYYTDEKTGKPREYGAFYDQVPRKDLEKYMIKVNDKLSDEDFSDTYRYLEACDKKGNFIMRIMKSYLGNKKTA